MKKALKNTSYIKFTSNGAPVCAEMKKSHNLEYPQENKHERSEVFVFTGYDNDKIRECVSTATAEQLDFGV